MNKKKVLILEKERIAYKLRRMAYEIWEHNSNGEEIILIGIEKGGKILADNLAAILKEISPLKIRIISVNIDKKNPLSIPPDLKEDLNGRTVIMVDDVVNSGKTIFYSLKALLPYNLKKLSIAVLVDRKHKSFPVAADIVGHSIATTLQEHIEVETQGNEITAVYLE
jgi:pyrimidine operon attenuation protein / uracil phosphoribosyltransferase